LLRIQRSIVEVQGGGGFKFTDAGYMKYLPQINAWRLEAAGSPERTKGNAPDGKIDLGLLFKIMRRLGELRSERLGFTTSDRLFELTDRGDRTESEIASYIDAHLEFLRGRGYVELGDPTMFIRVRTVTLTTEGVIFVQPELADFGQRSVLPDVAKSLEKQIEILTYPSGESEGLLFNLRDAIARNAPDLIAKILVEIGGRIARGGGA